MVESGVIKGQRDMGLRRRVDSVRNLNAALLNMFVRSEAVREYVNLFVNESYEI
jgi:hypothetical protein